MGEVMSFHGLASFYKRFVPNFTNLASPLNELVKKDVIFCWKEKHDQAFQKLNAQLINAFVLSLSEFSKKIELECDASRVDICSILLQGGHSIAYFSYNLHGASINYPTYEKNCIL